MLNVSRADAPLYSRIAIMSMESPVLRKSRIGSSGAEFGEMKLLPRLV